MSEWASERERAREREREQYPCRANGHRTVQSVRPTPAALCRSLRQGDIAYNNDGNESAQPLPTFIEYGCDLCGATHLPSDQ